MKGTIIIIVFFCMAACKQRTYRVEITNASAYHPDTAFAGYEDISLARFDSLKTKYQLDTIFHGEKDEFRRILLLRNWIRQKIDINDFGDPYPGNDYPQGILDAAMHGQGFHCGHYMMVQNAVMNAYGYVTRCLGSGPGIKGGADGHHGMNEIWLNKYGKWFLSDAKFNHHFEKNGIPLSALEIRDEYLKNRAKDILLVKGPDREVIEIDSLKDRTGVFRKRNKEWFAQWYTWLEWDKKANRFSAWPAFTTKLNMFSDDYSRKNKWYWDGKPHWAYNTDQISYQDRREAIEWTPNIIQPAVTITDAHAKITLASTTPNFKEYQVLHAPDSTWIKCDSQLNVDLEKHKEEFQFRTMNVAAVPGPVCKISFTEK